MHLTVVNDHPHITCIGSGEWTLLHACHDSFHDGRQEACVDGATHDAVHEYQLATPLQLNHLRVAVLDLELLTVEAIDLLHGHTFGIGFNDEVYLTELAGTTRLFLVAIIGAGSLGDSLAVRYLRLYKFNLNLIVVLEAPFQCTQVKLTLA